MIRKTWTRLILIVILAIVAGWVDLPNNPGVFIQVGGLTIDKPITVQQGLDLQGGLSVILQAQPSAGQLVTPDAMQAAKGVIENRVNGLGVAEPLIQLSGQNRIIVELPGLKDPAEAIKLFGSTGLLEFLNTGSTSVPVGCPIPYPDGHMPPVAAPAGAGCPTADQLGRPQAVLTGSDVNTAAVGYDQLGAPLVNVTLNGTGGSKMSAFSGANVGNYLTVTMDRVVVESAVIKQQLDANFQISGGSMSLADAKQIVLEITYGALPIAMTIVQEDSVGPTLGQESVDRSLIAGGIGLGIVMLFMFLYYWLPGLLADVALIIYAAVVFAIFKLIPVTLTLAGIAGFILSIGMAVDANVLTFERLKEELRAHKTLNAAMEAAFDRAWPSIRDSNVSTMLTCGVLWFFGSGSIKGFAVTLFIGVVTSLFSALFVTRTFLRVAGKFAVARNARLYGVESVPANA